MKDVLIKEFPVARLEYVFQPPGLPLVTKTKDKPATTSILIRGGPGTGKTTLAAAIAHAIAKEHEGAVLYLTTEFVPTELRYKAKQLKLPEGSVVAWGTKGELPAGAILAEHLSRTEAGEETTTSAERKRAAINAVWELLLPTDGEKNEEKEPSRPVRVVVIDAFGLPEPEEDDLALRSDLLALVQALEMEGISAILIEEVGGESSHWLPFVVDVVFELRLVSDPDTGDLIRKLICSKSRYTPSLPGPHDYGLDGGRPSVWPDLLPSFSHMNHLGIAVKNPGLFIPVEGSSTQYMKAVSGTITASPIARPLLMRALANTPGLRRIFVDCGPMTKTWFPELRIGSLVADHAGPFSIFWSIVSIVKLIPANTVIFQGSEFFFSRHQRYRMGILHVLEMLRGLGFIVCVHGRSEDLLPVVPIANHMPETTSNLVKTLEGIRSLLSASWLFSDGNTIGATTSSERKPRSKSSEAWALARKGDDILAANKILLETDSSVPPLLLPLWLGLCAIYGSNDVALAELEKMLSTADEHRAAGWLLRALATRARFDDAERLITELTQKHQLPAWFADRLRADLRLESNDPAVLNDALPQLARLADDDCVPPVHRAEVLYNMGVAHERLGATKDAIEAYQRALTFQPDLAVAKNRLNELTPTT